MVVTLPAPPASAAPEIAPAPDAVASAAETRRGLMWRVSSARNVAYLLGSIHMASRDLYPLPAHIEQAFEKSNVLVVEVDLNKLDRTKFQGLMVTNGLYPREDSLWNHIGPATRQMVVDFCGRHGMDPEAFARMKPWMAAMATSLLPVTEAQQDLAPGIDKYFLDKTGDRMRIEPLESAEYQFRIASTMPEVQQERTLRSAVRNAGQGAEDVRQLQAMWLAGDAERLAEYVAASMRDDPEYAKRVYTDRNPRMAERAEQCLRSRDRCFIAVGAGHMVGREGIVRMLETRGYKVEQVLGPQ